MATGNYGVVRPADVTIDDIQVFYSFAPNRNATPTPLLELDSGSVITRFQSPNTVNGSFNLFAGLYNLTLPEHFSIWSLIDDAKNINIEKVFITASGGPFNKLNLNKFKKITIKQALKHPNWKMGKKITIDSATLMNKVFEIIEAKKIFNYKYSQLNILIHPASYVHAIIKFNNGLTKMLIHDTNMKIPIFNSFYSKYEKKIRTQKLNFNLLSKLNFTKVDTTKFPVVKILKKMPHNDSLFETVIVSANDKLVDLFLKKKITFNQISTFLLKIIKMKEFTKFKKIKVKNIDEIIKLNSYVSLKINKLTI